MPTSRLHRMAQLSVPQADDRKKALNLRILRADTKRRHRGGMLFATGCTAPTMEARGAVSEVGRALTETACLTGQSGQERRRPHGAQGLRRCEERRVCERGVRKRAPRKM